MQVRLFNNTGPANSITFYRTSTVPDQVMRDWLKEIESLPNRKLKQWKSALIDPYGIRCQVRYSIVPLPTGPNHTSHFKERLSTQACVNSGFPGENWIPVQSVSQRAEVHRYAQTVAGQVFGPTTLIENDNEHVSDAYAGVMSRATGNHKPHRCRISVPTAAGEPVRG